MSHGRADYKRKHPTWKNLHRLYPDEEVGRGADFFDVEGFGADFAYTVDGGAENEIEYENFNAAGAKVKIKGFSVHTAAAKIP